MMLVVEAVALGREHAEDPERFGLPCYRHEAILLGEGRLASQKKTISCVVIVGMGILGAVETKILLPLSLVSIAEYAKLRDGSLGLPSRPSAGLFHAQPGAIWIYIRCPSSWLARDYLNIYHH